jgi:hypothetical protein
MALVVPSSAMAVPGDDAISNPTPGEFRLDPSTLEPGCFDLGRIGPWFVGVDASSFDAADDSLPDGELRLSNNTHVGPVSFDVDQVLVPSEFGGYNVRNQFDTGTIENDNDISAGQVGVEMFAPDANGNGNPDPIEGDDVIVCLSDDQTASQNEPYSQEAGGLVSAKNRPTIQPHVTAFGWSAVEPLNTYRIGFGYSVEQWYTAPTFDGHGLFSVVTDPEQRFGTDSAGIPNAVRLKQRLDDLPYDSRRVNDVDKAGESWVGGDPDAGQDIYFSRNGDLTAWTDSNGNGLLTTITQGDMQGNGIQWALRPSLSAPNHLREVSFTDNDFRALEAAWQAYYRGEGPKPTMQLAPGTNSPTPNSSIVINLPETRPTDAPQQPITNTTNNVTNTNVTGGGVVVSTNCTSNRRVKFTLRKGAKRGTVRYMSKSGIKTTQAKRSNGRLRATADFRGVVTRAGVYVSVTVREKTKSNKWVPSKRLLKLCK